MTATTADATTRRDFLYVATGAMGAVGAAFAAWPFIDQMNPTSAALALASIEVDISPIRSASRSCSNGAAIRCSCAAARPRKSPTRGRAGERSARSDRAQRHAARQRAGHRRQPRQKAEWLILIGVCTHLGCTPSSRRVPKAITAAGSATAMARNTTPPAASAKVRRRRIWRCRPTPSCLTPASRSVEENKNVRPIDLQAQDPVSSAGSITRLPLPRLMHDTMRTFPTPRNLNIWYTFGGILTFCLGVQIVTGIVLAMHYVANAELAFDSVESIMRDVNYGWLMRYMHSNGASMFFLAVYIHMFRGLYYGSYKAPRELIWIIGVLIYVLMMATAFFGYVLPWGQMSFWGATVITNLFTRSPSFRIVGTHIATWLWGDFAVGDATLNRFFSLHYLLPFIIAGVVGLHIWALHVPGNNNPLGIDVKSPQDTVPFHPYYTVKDAFYLCPVRDPVRGLRVLRAELLRQSGQLPAGQSAGDAARHRAGMVSLALLRDAAFDPEQADRRDRAGAARIVTLVFIPWLDTSPGALLPLPSADEAVLLGLRGGCVLLGYCGSQSVDAVATWSAFRWSGWRASGTLYYFAFFWVIMPIVGLIETPKKLPASIAQSVLGDTAAAPAE